MPWSSFSRNEKGSPGTVYGSSWRNSRRRPRCSSGSRISDAVEPLERHRVLGLGGGVGVVAGLVEPLRHAVLEVRVAEAQGVRRGVVGEQEGVRVELGEVEGAAGGEEVVDDLRPALEVAEPDERPPGREHDVEAALQHVGQVLDVAAHEGGARGEAGLAGQRARRPDALRRRSPRRSPRRLCAPSSACRARSGTAGAEEKSPRATDGPSSVSSISLSDVLPALNPGTS